MFALKMIQRVKSECAGEEKKIAWLVNICMESLRKSLWKSLFAIIERSVKAELSSPTS